MAATTTSTQQQFTTANDDNTEQYVTDAQLNSYLKSPIPSELSEMKDMMHTLKASMQTFQTRCETSLGLNAPCDEAATPPPYDSNDLEVDEIINGGGGHHHRQQLRQIIPMDNNTITKATTKKGYSVAGGIASASRFRPYERRKISNVVLVTGNNPPNGNNGGNFNKITNAQSIYQRRHKNLKSPNPKMNKFQKNNNHIRQHPLQQHKQQDRQIKLDYQENDVNRNIVETTNNYEDVDDYEYDNNNNNEEDADKVLEQEDAKLNDIENVIIENYDDDQENGGEGEIVVVRRRRNYQEIPNYDFEGCDNDYDDVVDEDELDELDSNYRSSRGPMYDTMRRRGRQIQNRKYNNKTITGNKAVGVRRNWWRMGARCIKRLRYPLFTVTSMLLLRNTSLVTNPSFYTNIMSLFGHAYELTSNVFANSIVSVVTTDTILAAATSAAATST